MKHIMIYCFDDLIKGYTRGITIEKYITLYGVLWEFA